MRATEILCWCCATGWCMVRCSAVRIAFETALFRWGHSVAQLVEALHYKLEDRGFDSRWCHWNFSLTKSFLPHSGPGVDSASNRNK